MIRLIVATVFALALTPFGSVLSLAQDLTAEQVIEKSFAAQGGKENLEKIHTRVASGKVEVLGGFLGDYHSWAKAPDKLKTKWDIGVIQQERGFDGTNGWEKSGTVRELVERDLARLRQNAVFDPLLTYVDAQAPMESRGKEKVDGIETYVIEVHPPGGAAHRFYFDTKTFLPIREDRTLPFEEGEVPIAIRYGEYRKVGQVMLPFSISEPMLDEPLSIRVQEYRLNVPIEDDKFQNSMAQYAKEPYEITLATIPKHVYKENDGIFAEGWERFWAIPYGPTENWLFNVVVNEKYGRQVKPASATLEYYSGQRLQQRLEFSEDDLQTIKKSPVTRFAPQPQIYDFRYQFSNPVALGIDRAVYTLEVATPSGQRIRKSLEIPLKNYQLRKKYIFPIKGKFIVTDGHEFYELGHKYEWSQHFSYDIMGLGQNLELAKNDGKTPQDYYGWGREIVAPADGVVVYARNDVPDMTDPRDYLKMRDGLYAIGGNIILIDHGDGEYSLFAHTQFGEVRIKTGDRVTQGQVIALMGCSGSPGLTHLHYQLQAGPGLFDSDGLPTRFENIHLIGWVYSGQKLAMPKRGVYMEAK